MKNITIRYFLIYLTISLFAFSCGNDDDQENNNPSNVSTFRISFEENEMDKSYNSYNGYIIASTNTDVTFQENRSHQILFTDGEIFIENGEIKYDNNTTFVVEYDLGFSDYGDPRIIEIGNYNYPSNSSYYISNYSVQTNVVVSNGNITSSQTTAAIDNGVYNEGSFNILLNDDDYYEINFSQALSGLYSAFWGEYNGALITLEL